MAPPRAYQLTAPGRPSLTVHDFGGDGPAVLFAHATGFHGLAWTPVAERLRAADRHPYALDFGGHGTSGPSPDGYDWDGFREDALAVADHLALRDDPDAIAVGHSMGGAAVLLAEAAAPGTFTRLWVYEPIVFKTPPTREPDTEFPLALGARRRRARFASRAAAYEAYAAKPSLGVFTPEALHAYVDHAFADRPDGTVELRCTPEVESEVFSMAVVSGLWAQLPTITAPVAVVCGEHSDAIPPKVAAAIAAELPRGHTEVMAALGHFGPMEDPDACARSILAFDT